MVTQTKESSHQPERVGLGATLSLTGSTARLFGRSIFKNHALYLVEVGTLVVAGVEFGIGAAILVFFAYRFHVSGALGLWKGAPPPRLHFTRYVVVLMAVIGALNIASRGFIALALDSPGTTITLLNAFGFSVPLLYFSVKAWKNHRVAALVVPVLMSAGLAATAAVWDSDASLPGIGWALACGLCGLLYLPLSKHVFNQEKAAADQFQALNTVTGAVGLFAWALIAGENFTEGWSWRLLGILVITSVLTVVVPRYLHVLTRRAIGDGLYTVLATLSLPLAVGVDYVMERSVPGGWQAVGLSAIAAVALVVTYLEWRDGRQPDTP